MSSRNGGQSTTTKDISLLRQLNADGQLVLTTEFQRNGVWPKPAKAYLIDTILNDRPMPLFFFLRGRSAQSGRSIYSVIDGQQRLRAIFEFLDNRFALTESNRTSKFYKQRFSELGRADRERLLNYNLTVEELTGYVDKEIRDIFVRMNKFVVKLSPQELRHARGRGAFHNLVEAVGKWPFWEAVFTRKELARMRAVEFAGELFVLLVEGPQDKKAALDLYYHTYQRSFADEKAVTRRLQLFLKLVESWLPDFGNTRFSKAVDLYGLVGAMQECTNERLRFLNSHVAGRALLEFDRATRRTPPTGLVAEYLFAASRQTDNLAPRAARIRILKGLISGQTKR